MLYLFVFNPHTMNKLLIDRIKNFRFPSFHEMNIGFSHLVWPCTCQLCGDVLVMNYSEYVCLRCIRGLPKTHFEDTRNNPIYDSFIGRADIYSAFAGYYFRKGERLRKLIHAFKYYGRADVAFLLGKQLGNMMKKAEWHKDYDFLVPIPLHRKKMKFRGYNQAEMIARGISSVIGLPIINDILIRVKEGVSQTKKTYAQRWTELQGTYESINTEKYIGARMILVDDVLTTGATIEVCSNLLNKIPMTRVGVVTLGAIDRYKCFTWNKTYQYADDDILDWLFADL